MHIIVQIGIVLTDVMGACVCVWCIWVIPYARTCMWADVPHATPCTVTCYSMWCVSCACRSNVLYPVCAHPKRGVALV